MQFHDAFDCTFRRNRNAFDPPLFSIPNANRFFPRRIKCTRPTPLELAREIRAKCVGHTHSV
jgi:hypothetical protein